MNPFDPGALSLNALLGMSESSSHVPALRPQPTDIGREFTPILYKSSQSKEKDCSLNTLASLVT